MRKEYVITIMLLAACSAPMSAQYCEDLSIVISGTGDVYVGGGHSLGTSLYQQDFDVPSGNVKWVKTLQCMGICPFWVLQ